MDKPGSFGVSCCFFTVLCFYFSYSLSMQDTPSVCVNFMTALNKFLLSEHFFSHLACSVPLSLSSRHISYFF